MGIFQSHPLCSTVAGDTIADIREMFFFSGSILVWYLFLLTGPDIRLAPHVTLGLYNLAMDC